MDSRSSNILARLLVSVSLTFAAAASGCGESRPASDVPTYPVRGKVVLASGEPLTSGLVCFVSGSGDARRVVGTLTADGTFSVMTDGIFAGAPAGDYKVRIEQDPDAAAVGSPKAKGKAVVQPLPAKYRNESASGLTATVKAEPENELPPIVIR